MPATTEFNWLTAISPALVVLGWIVVNWQTNRRETRKDTRDNRRETRKEIRTGLEALYKILADIETDAIKFHTSDAWDELLSQALTYRIDRVIKRIEILNITLRAEDHLTQDCIRFRQSITLNNFDRSSHCKLSAHDTVIHGINESHERIFKRLEKAYHHNFLS